MNWKWIWILSGVSVISSCLTVFGKMPEGMVGGGIGLAISFVVSAVLARTSYERFFRNGFALGAVGGTIGTLVQLFCFNAWLEHSEKMSEQMSKAPGNPIGWVAAFAPIGIAAAALFQGLFTW